jgi:hypothetical protein
MKREVIASIGTLDEQGHHEDRKGRDRIPFKRGRTEDQPKDRIDNDNDECGGMPCCLPDKGRPVIFDGLDHATSYYKRSTS